MQAAYWRKAALFAGLLAAGALLSFDFEPREQVGPLPGGGFLLNSGWQLQPAGRQVPLDTLPLSTALSPDGKYLLVLNAGYNAPTVSVLDTATEKELSRVRVTDGWLGLAMAPTGDRVWVGGGGRGVVYEFSFSAGKLALTRTLQPVANRVSSDFIGDVALSPDGSTLAVANLMRDTVILMDAQSGEVRATFRPGRRPYRLLYAPDGALFVSNWADGAVVRYDGTATLAKLETGPHPTDMLWQDGRLFVAVAHTNYVAVADPAAMRVTERISVAISPWQPPGMTPSALALSPDGKRLYVACSDANAVAVADVSGPDSRVLGFVPTGWYPTAVRALAGGRLVVLNGRGLRSYPNPKRQYVARIQTGSASFIDPFDEGELYSYTSTALENSAYRDEKMADAQTGPGNPVPSQPGDPSPIRHVIYIVKENRTYDQVFGDMPQGNGDPSLVLFGEEVTPNQHNLAREFTLFDNFYVNADVSAQGHNWSTAGIAPDYVEKLWPNNYGGRGKAYDFEGSDPAAAPPSGYIWTRVDAAGLSIGNYGYFVSNLSKPAADGRQVSSVRDPVLRNATNLYYRGWDLDYPDVERARVFAAGLASFEQSGDFPRFSILRLGNNHTSGATAGKIAPLSAVADNDYAVGIIVDAVSRSRFWPYAVIFILEDDAQDGPDHVDSHRSPALVISPYIRRGVVDSTMYNTAGMLRTMELILGLEPMTHFDAAARPMSAAFQTEPDLRPYTAAAPRIPLDNRNPARANAPALDLSAPDRVDERLMNDLLWRAIRGTEPPAPVRSIFGR